MLLASPTDAVDRCRILKNPRVCALRVSVDMCTPRMETVLRGVCLPDRRRFLRGRVMQINLGPAVAAGVATAISVLDEYFQELYRIERIPPSIPLEVPGSVFELTVFLDVPRFEMVKAAAADPYTRLLLTGSVERRLPGDLGAPEVFPLDLKVLLTIVELPGAKVGLRFDGLDGTPSPPLTENDVGWLFSGPVLSPLLAGIQLPLGESLIKGLEGLDPGGPLDTDTTPVNSWPFEVVLMPAGSDTVDSFVASIGVPTSQNAPLPVLRESFVLEGQEFAIAFSDEFMSLILRNGAHKQEGQAIAGTGATILAPFMLSMNSDSMQVNGKALAEVPSILPDVTVSFVGPMHPFLVRGTTIMGFNVDEIDVDVSDFAEAFYWVVKWFITVLAGALLFTGWGFFTAVGILTWMTAVPYVWGKNVLIEDAPNLARQGLANALGAGLAGLAVSLDDDTDIGQVRVDSTPDSVRVVDFHLVFFAQVLVSARTMQLVAAEYSKKLRRFVIFELEDGRRFRAQELARLMATDKLTVPGFHQVGGKYIRADPDNATANNLLKTFKANLTSEVVVRNS